jgi:hypothetical protein
MAVWLGSGILRFRSRWLRSVISPSQPGSIIMVVFFSIRTAGPLTLVPGFSSSSDLYRRKKTVHVYMEGDASFDIGYMRIEREHHRNIRLKHIIRFE